MASLLFLGFVAGNLRWNRTPRPEISTKYESRKVKPRLIIVKGGGSALTRKSDYETLDSLRLNATARQIRCSLESEDIKIVFVHGAGSFGHFDAKKFSLKSGGNEMTWCEGVSRTRRSVVKLNQYVIESFIDSGINAVSVEMFPLCRIDPVDGSIQSPGK